LKNIEEKNITFEDFKKSLLQDYQIACESREASLLGRKEVLTGKAKFGIFGDGKELAQLAMARVFKLGDFRSGYYRDQTFMLAKGLITLESFFSQLFANPSLKEEPASAGRQMNSHFATRFIDTDGNWKNLTREYNSSADLSPTASQMPRLLGLAQASKIYRENIKNDDFSVNGNEIAFGTIGNASTSEGLFFETINAAGVIQVPMIVSIWDDDWGISVPSKYHTTKENISDLLKGFQRTKQKNGFALFKVKGWDLKELYEVYSQAEEIARLKHIPVIIHVTEMTQPQGHSTSGSHERYKSKERLKWEKEFDCMKKMREYLLSMNYAKEDKLIEIEKSAKIKVQEAKNIAWKKYLDPILEEKTKTIQILNSIENPDSQEIKKIANNLNNINTPARKDIIIACRKAMIYCRKHKNKSLNDLLQEMLEQNKKRYNSFLYSESKNNVKHIKHIEPNYDIDAKHVDGRIILRENFDALLKKDKSILIFGEDCGNIGDVNQGLEGLQKKYGENRVFDTGIREATIIGQGIGMALRGLRPIAEIQYLDYLLYAIQILSDDLASLEYRTFGGQKSPLIIRTRGHRLEGIWHSGSPMGGIINLLRGINILVPRNMLKAAGFYNSLLQSDEPGLIIECLNGYRLKEKMPINLGTFTTPIGKIDIINEGNDITVVTYGSCCRIAQEAALELEKINISIEVIDIQSLIPFDIDNEITNSLMKTNRVIFFDEDVSGGSSAYMMQKVLEEQDGYKYLDSSPKTVTSKDHRPAYGDDGDYFSKSNKEDLVEKCYELMHEYDPTKFPNIYENN
tara:strand:- start:70 stop:2463 length:2394 start_codon:yes stop_codon:yes gene_type:complete